MQMKRLMRSDLWDMTIGLTGLKQFGPFKSRQVDNDDDEAEKDLLSASKSDTKPALKTWTMNAWIKKKNRVAVADAESAVVKPSEADAPEKVCDKIYHMNA
jgi:hypothetical protein